MTIAGSTYKKYESGKEILLTRRGDFLIAKAFDVNGVIERYSWSSSEPDSINMSDSDCYDILLDENGVTCIALEDWFSLDICEDVQKEVNQTITITVYDND